MPKKMVKKVARKVVVNNTDTSAPPVNAAMSKLNSRIGGRTITSKGRAQSLRELETQNAFFTNIYTNPAMEGKVKVWLSGVGKTYSNGTPLVWRFMPALSVGNNAAFVPGRNPMTLGLSEELVCVCYTIEKFGSSRKVAFIPSQPYAPQEGCQHPPYEGVHDNPYALIQAMIRADKRTGLLRDDWAPLGYTKKECTEAMKKAGLSGSFVTPLLPFPKPTCFAYGLIYKGYDLDAQNMYENPQCPYGSLPEHGLQLVKFNNQVYDALTDLYSRCPEEDPDNMNANRPEFPDPADINAGALNYAWNSACVSPITGQTKSSDALGYTAAVSRFYFPRPRAKETVELRINDELAEWYYNNWQPWDEVLHATVAGEQVRLIAEYFPELGEVCARAWEGRDELMEAYDKCNWSKESVDFRELFIKLNSRSDNGEGEGTSRGYIDNTKIDDREMEYQQKPAGKTAAQSAEARERSIAKLKELVKFSQETYDGPAEDGAYEYVDNNEVEAEYEYDESEYSEQDYIDVEYEYEYDGTDEE